VKRRLLAIPILLAVALSLGLAYWQAQPAPQQQAQAIQIIPILHVYKNGKLIYTKIGDPPTKNLAMALLITLIPQSDTSGNHQTLKFLKMDGNSWTYDPTKIVYNYNTGSKYPGSIGDHSLWVLAGSSNQPPSPNDYKIENAIAGEAKLVSLSYNSTTQVLDFVISGSVQANSNTTLYEVGLASDFPYDTSIDNPAQHPDHGILLFRDVIPNGIAVHNGDIVQIEYEIQIVLAPGQQ